ncbi:DoxX family protein [Erythrobacter sp. W53]|uniref:DoxX family protein n=1 Tax=Erythrobacter sp. W53 TaxID=3425947 RepID=UPI003D766CA9
MTRKILRWLLAIAYGIAGCAHIIIPEPFLYITPVWVPFPEAVIFWTGIAEIVGAIALAQPFWPKLRRWGAWGLAAYAVCVFPANINHFILFLTAGYADMLEQSGRLGIGYHIARMLAQPLIIWLSLWTGGVTDWPFRRRPSN